MYLPTFFFTPSPMQEHTHKPLEEVSFCFLGDAGYNMGDSLMIGAAKMGMDIRLAGPRSSWPNEAHMDQVRAVARETGARITVTEDALAAV
jgi:ornithine carbamoyltransferase